MQCGPWARAGRRPGAPWGAALPTYRTKPREPNPRKIPGDSAAPGHLRRPGPEHPGVGVKRGVRGLESGSPSHTGHREEDREGMSVTVGHWTPGSGIGRVGVWSCLGTHRACPHPPGRGARSRQVGAPLHARDEVVEGVRTCTGECVCASLCPAAKR